jgi:hypothetical protein
MIIYSGGVDAGGNEVEYDEWGGVSEMRGLRWASPCASAGGSVIDSHFPIAGETYGHQQT